MKWLEELDDIGRNAVLAATSHATIDLDFDLTDEEHCVAERIFADLNVVQDGGPPQGFAAIVPVDMHRAVWAATCAFAMNVHAPLDNLSAEDWENLDRLHETLNEWDMREPPRLATPSASH